MGDCWLLAAIACLAEHDGAIQAVFRTKEANPRGKYVLRLYDGAKERCSGACGAKPHVEAIGSRWWPSGKGSM